MTLKERIEGQMQADVNQVLQLQGAIAGYQRVLAAIAEEEAACVGEASASCADQQSQEVAQQGAGEEARPQLREDVAGDGEQDAD